MTPNQQKAIKMANEFAGKVSGSKWPKIQRKALASGLIARVKDPMVINQQYTSLCGPASFTYSLAHDDPVAYVKAAIELYTKGSTKVRDLKIEPGSELKSAAPQGKTDPADWIMLASIRDSDNWFFSPAGWIESLAGMTLPHSVEKWMHNAGYTQIVNTTYLAMRPIYSALANDLNRASELFGKGYKVLILVDGDVLRSDTQADFFSAFPTHWIALNSKIKDGGVFAYDQPISFSCFSWGKKTTVPRDSTKPLKKRDFLNKFYGYVAARL